MSNPRSTSRHESWLKDKVDEKFIGDGRSGSLSRRKDFGTRGTHAADVSKKFMRDQMKEDPPTHRQSKPLPDTRSIRPQFDDQWSMAARRGGGNVPHEAPSVSKPKPLSSYDGAKQGNDPSDLLQSMPSSPLAPASYVPSMEDGIETALEHEQGRRMSIDSATEPIVGRAGLAASRRALMPLGPFHDIIRRLNPLSLSSQLEDYIYQSGVKQNTGGIGADVEDLDENIESIACDDVKCDRETLKTDNQGSGQQGEYQEQANRKPLLPASGWLPQTITATSKDCILLPEVRGSCDEEDLARTSSPISSLGTSSPSEASTSVSAATDNSEINLATALVSSHGARQALASLQSFFSRFMDLRLGVREIAGGHEGSSSRDYLKAAQYSTFGVSTITGQTSNSSSKRSRQTDGDGSGESPGEGPRPKRLMPDPVEKVKIACPFMKNSPERFSAWRTCVGPGFDGMNRMKEHLKRRHFKEHTCERCGDLFGSKKALQNHQRLPTPCILRDAPVEEGFLTSTQWDEITRKRSRCSLEERWKEIYLILFPDTPPHAIPSPYFDTLDVTNNDAAMFDPEEYEEYLKTHLPSRVLMRLQEELAVFSETIKGQLAVIVQEESSETLKAYVRQKGERRNEVLSESTNPLPDLPAPDEDFFRDINMFGDDDLFDLGFLNGDSEWQAGNGKGKEPADSGYGSLN
ncbi:hypothetical protein CGMCC3_g16141 [Colletotrichum fructicola]|uniref:C2H2-type domain-containing protein n=2 Tax=Colletotrichum fructicola (strain Nara gc5) TaxID=1213859 RepID=A0A7J6IHW8_COLFN|nr:uncharacterized protein CGMCC3_g16141 [Colletotrichum fructicola]KAE9567744.1 hypothetical protein CGMCC3_g16141 [Colletotrichum fructicola]KAF4424291.1 hypothetical protein CFRS1_v013427 [Colletotrichum fructicola]KAF4476228.1 hypothetical protein CGGC5_v015178 [Colletotrichum fructicola Nara gc5]